MKSSHKAQTIIPSKLKNVIQNDTLYKEGLNIKNRLKQLKKSISGEKSKIEKQTLSYPQRVLKYKSHHKLINKIEKEQENIKAEIQSVKTTLSGLSKPYFYSIKHQKASERKKIDEIRKNLNNSLSQMEDSAKKVKSTLKKIKKIKLE